MVRNHASRRRKNIPPSPDRAAPPDPASSRRIPGAWRGWYAQYLMHNIFSISIFFVVSIAVSIFLREVLTYLVPEPPKGAARILVIALGADWFVSDPISVRMNAHGTFHLFS
jgi:hypothetical protein